MRVEGRNFTVVGAGVSGVAAANLLESRGGNVRLTDHHPTRERPVELNAGVEYQAGSNDVRDGDIAVLSPGIPEVSPVRLTIADQASEVMGEVELFYRLCPAPIIAVTGTDGKSTVTTMIGDICRAAGITTHVGGNLGIPLTTFVPSIRPEDVVVAEVSCFQLTTCDTFKPQVAVITNIAEDHVDYHGSFLKYQAAKQRVAAFMVAEDHLILNGEDDVIAAWEWQPRAKTTRFSLQSDTAEAFRRDGKLWLTQDDHSFPFMACEDLPLLGEHNLANALAAAAASAAFGIDASSIQQGLKHYEALPHRLKRVAQIHGVTWVNDSKATNPNAATAALKASDQPTILLAGGSVKDTDFTEFGARIRKHTERAILFGATQEALALAIGPNHSVTRVQTLDEAVQHAYKVAQPGSMVLLSPACASYDQFNSYAHRGEVFEQLVEALKDEFTPQP